VAAAVFLFLLTLTGYGLWHEHLFQQSLWLPAGLTRFLLFAVCYWPVALVLPPRWLGGVAAAFVLGYSMWWCGPVAPLAVLFLFGSAFFLGKRIRPTSDAPTATLSGLAVFIFCGWIALHFEVNRPWVYAMALAFPWLLEAHKLRQHASAFRFTCDSRKESLALALLIFVLMAHWLVALKPEVSSDGLSMHLALPMTVAHQERWDFDFQQQTWAVMPVGGDALFTAGYLLGGESAARLVNLSMLLLIVALIVSACRRWLTLSQALLTAALFASTPLVQLVTGSLFVENVWAALVLGALLALARFWEYGDASEVPIAGLLLGAALAVKLIAAVFLLPAAILGLATCWKHKKVRAFVAGATLIATLGAPAYLYAWERTGNPVFPFVNATFRSPYFDATTSFKDSRFNAPLDWKTPYDLTFRSANYFEGQPGAAGFQYLLLLVPALLTLRTRFAWLVVGSGLLVCLVLLIALPNLRYLYPALPLLSIGIGSILVERKGCGAHLRTEEVHSRRTRFAGDYMESPVAGTWAVVGVTALNLWFLPSAGWYHQDFAFFKHAQAREYVEHAAPIRLLFDRLNRTEPGRPVALFTGDGVAGLNAAAYTNTWHSEAYWLRVRGARFPKEIAEVFREYKIQTIIAPLSFESQFPVVRSFLRQWAAPSGVQRGDLGIFHLRDQPILLREDAEPLPLGQWDDLDDRIEYVGRWLHDRQFPQSSGQSVTYSGDVGDTLGFKFTGSKVTYIYTKASNRGRALVLVDGREAARIEMYSAETQWQAQTVFEKLGPGTHTFEVRVLEDKDSRSAGRAVDLDGIVVGK
jgi:hypothetical protein